MCVHLQETLSLARTRSDGVNLLNKINLPFLSDEKYKNKQLALDLWCILYRFWLTWKQILSPAPIRGTVLAVFDPDFSHS